jgi:hypothetical protein
LHGVKITKLNQRLIVIGGLRPPGSKYLAATSVRRAGLKVSKARFSPLAASDLRTTIEKRLEVQDSRTWDSIIGELANAAARAATSR